MLSITQQSCGTVVQNSSTSMLESCQNVRQLTECESMLVKIVEDCAQFMYFVFLPLEGARPHSEDC